MRTVLLGSALCALLGMLTACGGSNSIGSTTTAGSSTTNPASSSSSTGSPLVAFTSASYTAAPSSSALVAIYRTGGATGAATVGYTTINGTAKAGTDYVATSGTVTWADGDSAVKTIAVPVMTQASGKGFAVWLTSVAGQLSFGSPTVAAVAVALTPGGAAAAAGASMISSGSSGQILDSAHNVWTLVAGVAYEGGKPAGYSANVALLLSYAGTIYQENNGCLWWSWNGSTWVASSNPDPSVTPACSSSTATAKPPSSSGSSSSSSSAGADGLTVGSDGKIHSIVDGSQVDLIGAAFDVGGTQCNGCRIVGTAGLTAADYTTALNNAYNSLSSAGKPYGKINFIRVVTTSQEWMGYDCVLPFSDDAGDFTAVGGGLYRTGLSATAYQAYIRQIVATIRSAGLYVLIDMHGSTGVLTSTGQYLCTAGQSGMPTPADVPFWTSVANTFKNDPGVMFELFNEPFYDGNYNDAVSAAGVAALGGTATLSLPGPVGAGCVMYDNVGGSFNTAPILGGGAQCEATGHQSLINAIRATGATNIIWASSPWYAGSPDKWLQMKLSDPLHQLGMAFHGYGYAGGIAAFNAVAAAGYPILATELGTLAHIPSSYNYFRSQGWGYCWWAGSSNGDWNNWGAASPATIAAAIASDPPWTNNGSPTPTGSN